MVKSIGGNVWKVINNLLEWLLENWWIVAAIVFVILLYSMKQLIFAIITGQ